MNPAPSYVATYIAVSNLFVTLCLLGADPRAISIFVKSTEGMSLERLDLEFPVFSKRVVVQIGCSRRPSITESHLQDKEIGEIVCDVSVPSRRHGRYNDTKGAYLSHRVKVGVGSHDKIRNTSSSLI